MDKSIKGAANELGSLIAAKPINWPKSINTGIAKVHIKRNLLAEVDIPLHYAGGEYFITVHCYGEYEVGRKSFADFYCEVQDEPADWLPESLQQELTNEILEGKYD